MLAFTASFTCAQPPERRRALARASRSTTTGACRATAPGSGCPAFNELPGTQQLRIKYRDSAVSPLLEERTDLVPDFVKVIVRQGVSFMPQFRKTEISDADLDALAAYLARNPTASASPAR